MPNEGLSTAKAQSILRKVGPNSFERRKPRPAILVLLSQFLSPLIYILLFASIATFVLGEHVDAVIIMIAVLINTSLGFIQEYKAQNALFALSKVLSPQARVLRDGKTVTIPASEIVPGDLIEFEAGDQIPADGLIIFEKEVMINEAVLTGESAPVKKDAGSAERYGSMVSPQENVAKHFAYMGTTCINGTGKLLVFATGSQTEVGKIAHQLQTSEESLTPLQEKLKHFSTQLAVLVGALAVFIFIFGVMNGEAYLTMLKLSVAIAVSAIPEGLLISLTVILAIGMQRIFKRKALVRKLVAAETLGGVSVICTDKTGTITKGELTVFTVHSQEKEVIAQAAMLLSSHSDPLEMAARQWAERTYKKMARGVSIDEIPFSSQRRYSAKLTNDTLYVIGAPEVVLQKCTQKNTADLESQMMVYVKKGYRVVAVATRKSTASENRITEKQVSELRWQGFIVFSDPIRKDVASAFRQVLQAGISIKVITGDHVETARAVVEEVGLNVKEDQVMLGTEFKSLPMSQLRQRIAKAVLFARITPDQKLVIVKILQELGEVVAMTGDGVNDAPALKQADIGIVVSTATDVSKETADMVLLDDNFKTIVAAVEEGRGMFENLRKVILYLLSNAFVEMIFVIGSIILGLPLPVTAVQILWVNLATDVFPTLALTVDPNEKDLMKDAPKKKNFELIDLEMKMVMALISITGGLGILFLFMKALPHYELIHAQSLAFTVLATISLFYVFSSRSLRHPIWQEKLFNNRWLLISILAGFILQLVVIYVPFFQRVLRTTSLTLFDWGVVFGAGIFIVFLIEVVKKVFSFFHVASRTRRVEPIVKAKKT